MKKLLLALLLLSSSAWAQTGTYQTKPSMQTEINTNFADNTTGAITPAILRATVSDMLASWQQIGNVNAQTGTSYTIAVGDNGKLVTLNNASPVAVTLPQATTAFTNFTLAVSNIGAGTVTITPVTSTINGGATLVIASSQAAFIYSDGTNYQVINVGTGGGGGGSPTGPAGGDLTGTYPNPLLASMPTHTMKANVTAGTASPTNVTPTSWFDAVYCNTIGFLIVRTSGAWTCSKSIAANPVWWGADPLGAADSTSAFNSALLASTQIAFPPGKFRFLSAITYNIPAGINAVTITGAGQDNTILFWPSASGGISFNYASISSSVHVRDLSLTTGTANGGNAITLTLSTSVVNPAAFAQSDFYRVTCRGDDGYAVADYWTICTNIANVSNVTWEGVAFYGAATPNGQGIVLIGLPGSSTYGVAYNIAKSLFVNLNVGLSYGSYIQGVTVDQVNFTGDNSGILSPAASTGVLDQLLVTNSQFGPLTGQQGIVTSTTIIATQIMNNFFTGGAANENMINLASNNSFIISGNIIANSNTTGTNGIIVGTATGGKGVITGNDIFGQGTGISIGASAPGTSIQGNNLFANAAAISNSGVGTVIANNPGYNPLGPAAVLAGASPWTYTAGSSPETMYIWSGTVSSVTFDKNGGGLTNVACNTVPCTIDLGPFEQLKITYTVAPNLGRMIH